MAENPILMEILRTGQIQVASQFKDRSIFPHSVPAAVGMFLQGIIDEIQAEISVEVGFAFGVSTLFICEALKKSERTRHHVMDPFQTNGFDQVGLRHLKAAGYDQILNFEEKHAHLVLPRLEEDGVLADFAFIDSSHLFDYTLLDFVCVDRILRVGGVIVFDDANYPSIAKLCRFIEANRAYTRIGQVPDSGLARSVAFRKDAMDDRDFRHFSDF